MEGNGGRKRGGGSEVLILFLRQEIHLTAQSKLDHCLTHKQRNTHVFSQSPHHPITSVCCTSDSCWSDMYDTTEINYLKEERRRGMGNRKRSDGRDGEQKEK